MARKNPFKKILKFLFTVAVIIALIFAIDYFTDKSDIHTSATEKIHTAKEQLSDLAQEVASEIKTNVILQEEIPAPKPVKTAIQETVKKSENHADSINPPSSGKTELFPENLEIPLCAGTETDDAEDHQIRKFGNFVICYRESYEQAEWAAYCLEREELVKNASRGNDFRPDPEIKTGSASLADYKKSGYDRGHLAPAADFAFSEEAMSESFYLSNMSPQAPGLNREIWQYLEGQVRKWADAYGKVYVVTGPVLEKNAEEYDYIGSNKVSVPEYYYKVLLAPEKESAKAIAFILPNKKCPDTFWDYAVSIDEVEKRTCIDFFHLMEDTLENKLEANSSIEAWK